MIRLSIIIQAFTFWAIHFSTGFNPSLEKQSELALLGLHIQCALVPLVIIFIGGLLFLMLYDLTPEKVVLIKLN